MGIYGAPEIQKLKAKRDVEGLIKALGDKALDIDKRIDAARALGELKDERAVEPLIEALGSKFSGIRWAAAKVLGEIGDKRAIEPLAKACHDPDRYMRYYVVIALSQFKDDKNALKALKEFLLDAYPEIRRIAAVALGK
jgi:HEAT repeat protein